MLFSLNEPPLLNDVRNDLSLETTSLSTPLGPKWPLSILPSIFPNGVSLAISVSILLCAFFIRLITLFPLLTTMDWFNMINTDYCWVRVAILCPVVSLLTYCRLALLPVSLASNASWRYTSCFSRCNGRQPDAMIIVARRVFLLEGSAESISAASSSRRTFQNWRSNLICFSIMYIYCMERNTISTLTIELRMWRFRAVRQEEGILTWVTENSRKSSHWRSGLSKFLSLEISFSIILDQ